MEKVIDVATINKSLDLLRTELAANTQELRVRTDKMTSNILTAIQVQLTASRTVNVDDQSWKLLLEVNAIKEELQTLPDKLTSVIKTCLRELLSAIPISDLQNESAKDNAEHCLSPTRKEQRQHSQEALQLRKDLDACSQEMKTMQIELKKEVNECTAKIQDKNDIILKLKEEHIKSREKIQDKNEELAQVREELNELKEKMKEKDTDIQALRKDIKEDFDALSGKIQEKNEEIQTLRDNLKASDNEVQTLTDAITAVTGEMTNEKKKVVKLKDDFDECAIRIDKLERTNAERLKSEEGLTACTQDVKKLERKVKDISKGGAILFGCVSDWSEEEKNAFFNDTECLFSQSMFRNTRTDKFTILNMFVSHCLSNGISPSKAENTSFLTDCFLDKVMSYYFGSDHLKSRAKVNSNFISVITPYIGDMHIKYYSSDNKMLQ